MKTRNRPAASLVLGTPVRARLAPRALENSLLALAPQVAVAHDDEGRPAPTNTRPRRRRG